jgi:signal transduction histidine kinase
MHTGRDLLGMRKNGTEIYVEVGLTPLNNHRGNFVLASLMDVSELKEYEVGLRRANEELQRSNEELESFAYVASHDLRTPLRNIESLAEWIVEDAGDALPPECREHLDLMRQRVESMDQLLNGLLQYSRVGRKENAAEPVETGDVVAEVIELINPPERFTFDVAGDLPVLTAPRMAIRRVIQNLIENAVKHHNREDGRVEISCRENSDFFEFSIRDDGPGIEPRFHDRIFKMFQTLRSRDDDGGSGMGLAIVKKTVESFGGRVHLDSLPSEGACFRFTWRKS